MTRFMLTAMPFTGHVAPLSAVAEALVARGHDVRVYTGSAFRERVESTGARLVPWRVAPDFDENDISATFPRLLDKKGMRQLLINVQDVFIKTSPAQVEDLTAEWEREPWDAIAGDEMSVGTALFVERTACPWATVAVIPLNLIGPQGPPSGMGLAPGRNVLTQGAGCRPPRGRPLFGRSLAGPLARARQSVGLPPSKLTFDRVVFSPRLVIASGCPLLDYERTDRPSSVHFVGRLQTSPGPAAFPPWWSDLDGQPVVHVTQGTYNIDPEDLIRPSLEALAGRDVTVVVATGVPGRDELPFPVPSNARIGGFLPHAELLPRADAVVTNGGWGGTLAALAHGVPLVIAGGDLDKPEVAARVAWAGAGINLKTGTPTSAQVAAGVDRVLPTRRSGMPQPASARSCARSVARTVPPNCSKRWPEGEPMTDEGFRIRTYPAGVPCWVDVEQEDVRAGAEFYGALFGWDFVERRCAGSRSCRTCSRSSTASMRRVSKRATGCGLGELHRDRRHRRACVDVERAGGIVGRASRRRQSVRLQRDVRRPAGSGVPSVAGRHAPRIADRNVPGAWNFSELRTPDPAASLAFYGTVFGWRHDPELGAGMIRLPGYGDHLAATIDPDIHERQAFAPPGFADVDRRAHRRRGSAGRDLGDPVHGRATVTRASLRPRHSGRPSCRAPTPSGRRRR